MEEAKHTPVRERMPRLLEVAQIKEMQYHYQEVGETREELTIRDARFDDSVGFCACSCVGCFSDRGGGRARCCFD